MDPGFVSLLASQLLLLLLLVSVRRQPLMSAADRQRSLTHGSERPVSQIRFTGDIHRLQSWLLKHCFLFKLLSRQLFLFIAASYCDSTEHVNER
jgi:hypothetical protein